MSKVTKSIEKLRMIGKTPLSEYWRALDKYEVAQKKCNEIAVRYRTAYNKYQKALSNLENARFEWHKAMSKLEAIKAEYDQAIAELDQVKDKADEASIIGIPSSLDDIIDGSNYVRMEQDRMA